jgi:hypothetical protein
MMCKQTCRPKSSGCPAGEASKSLQLPALTPLARVTSCMHHRFEVSEAMMTLEGCSQTAHVPDPWRHCNDKARWVCR